MSAARQAERAELVRRSLFPTRPSGVVTQGFLRHVAETGCPETFAQISTTRPPSEGDLKVLTRFSASREKRLDQALAPCPICSPWDPKYLTGVLIWCEADAAIYAIGIECALTLWTDGRLDQEIAAHDRMVQSLTVENALLDRLPRVPLLRSWVTDHRNLVILVDQLCKSFRRDAPNVRRELADAARGDGFLRALVRRPPTSDQAAIDEMEVIGRLEGGGFLTSTAEMEKALGLCDLHLSFVDFGLSDDECLTAVCNMTAAEQRKADIWVREAVKTLSKISARIDAAISFLDPVNLATIRAWGRRLPRPIHAAGDARSVRLDRGGEVWFARLDGLRRPQQIPST
jgi:hypothetical protein